MPFTPYYYCIDRPIYRKSKRLQLFLAAVLLSLGGGILLWAGYPILWYELIEAPQLGQRTYLSPVSFATEANQFPGSETDNSMTNANNWFPQAGNLSSEPVVKPTYKLSIPSLGINQAEVEIGGMDLSEHLIHYSGTAFPGLPGTSVVFGHSVLPQFFDPNNYMAIFSTLHRMDLGDLIVVDYDGIQYHYQVIDKFEVMPDEIGILNQDFQNRQLLLVTCTPPGTYLRRLVIKSKLVPIVKHYDEKNIST